MFIWLDKSIYISTYVVTSLVGHYTRNLWMATNRTKITILIIKLLTTIHKVIYSVTKVSSNKYVNQCGSSKFQHTFVFFWDFWALLRNICVLKLNNLMLESYTRSTQETYQIHWHWEYLIRTTIVSFINFTELRHGCSSERCRSIINTG